MDFIYPYTRRMCLDRRKHCAFRIGCFLKDKAIQDAVYGVIGPFYAYFEIVWLFILIGTGFILGEHFHLFAVLNGQTVLDDYVKLKLILVAALCIATIIHLYIGFSTHKKTRSLRQKLLSRGGSLAIFILNPTILWVAINIRSILAIS
jgi:hypothetical protein